MYGVSAECTFVVAGAGSAVDRVASPSLSVCIEQLAPVGFSSSTPGTGTMSPCSRRFVWLGFGELGLPGLPLLVCFVAGVRGLVAAKRRDGKVRSQYANGPVTISNTHTPEVQTAGSVASVAFVASTAAARFSRRRSAFFSSLRCFLLECAIGSAVFPLSGKFIYACVDASVASERAY